MARRILTDFVIDKIAAVDRPCQEHARVTIMKRAPDLAGGKTAVAKLMEELADMVKKTSSEAASRQVAKLKIDALKVIATDISTRVEKAWSDVAREASAEARRHTGVANFHSKQRGGAHSVALDAHRIAAVRFQRTAEAKDRASGERLARSAFSAGKRADNFTAKIS